MKIKAIYQICLLLPFTSFSSKILLLNVKTWDPLDLQKTSNLILACLSKQSDGTDAVHQI